MLVVDLQFSLIPAVADLWVVVNLPIPGAKFGVVPLAGAANRHQPEAPMFAGVKVFARRREGLSAPGTDSNFVRDFFVEQHLFKP